MAEPEYRELSQAEFARELGVSRAAVSQWKANDILRDNAFTRSGKKGKLIFHIAVDQVRRNRDVGQALGNGISTRTTAEPVAPSPAEPAPAVPPVVGHQPALPMAAAGPVDPQPRPERPADFGGLPEADTVEDQIKRAKLEAQLRHNRIQAADEALRQGLLMSADEARAQMARIAGAMLQTFEGALPDFAAVVAERFDVPQRDVLHLLGEKFRSVRSEAAKKERERADEAQKDVTVSVDLDA